MMVKQADLPKLKYTNAEVLAYLLEHRNRKYVRAVDLSGKRLGEIDLLRMLKEYVSPLISPGVCVAFVVARSTGIQMAFIFWHG